MVKIYFFFIIYNEKYIYILIYIYLLKNYMDMIKITHAESAVYF